MRISLLTPTGDRHVAFAMCEKWMERQTRPPDEWIVTDDGCGTPTQCTMGQTCLRLPPEPGRHTLRRNFFAALEHVTGDIVAVVEDDDWYHPEYLETMAGTIERGYDMAGHNDNVFYNLRARRWYRNLHRHHSSLCYTAFRSSLIPLIPQAMEYEVRGPHSECFVDVRLWRGIACRKHIEQRGPLLCIGMKEMPGRTGIPLGRREGGLRRYTPDPHLFKLKELVGDDVEEYRGLL